MIAARDRRRSRQGLRQYLGLAARTGAALALLLACAGGERAADRSGAPSAGDPDILRIGTSGDYPPFSVFADADSHALAPVRGFDVELAEDLARELGVGIEWVPFRWPELEARVAAGAFDVVASGVTWRPARAVTGWMTRATAIGGPCVVGDLEPARVAVNRGGVLERFARTRFPSAEIVALDDNLALGGALMRRRADAVVTDSFERAHLGLEPELPFACEPKTDRKVLWIAPARAAELGPRLDAWLATHEQEIDEMRTRWLGGSAQRTDADHLLDLLARRLAYMPEVAAWKRARNVGIEDPAREAAVLDAARDEARRAGLEPESVAALFALQIEFGKRLQADPAMAPIPSGSDGLDLGAQIRPELVRLGTRIVAAAARIAPLDPGALDAADWAPLDAWLDPGERAGLRAALLALEPADRVAEVAVEDALPAAPTVDARLEEIRRLLQAALDYPPIARRIGLEGTAWLRFEIDREGAARDVAVARSSGHAVLDRAARQTVDRAGRLPWVYGRIEVPIRFSLDAPRS